MSVRVACKQVRRMHRGPARYFDAPSMLNIPWMGGESLSGFADLHGLHAAVCHARADD